MQRQVGKYKLIEQIGSGTAGVVYRAEDPDIGRSVAIKIMKAEYFGSPSIRKKAVERFSSEIRAIGRLAHSNIVSIFDSGITSEGLPYLVMQCVEGRGLDLIIRDVGGAFPPERTIKILRQLASAIDYAHSQNVLHRDIKPSNILVATDGHVYIVDFSTAVFADDTLLPTGQVVGTPQYMAPEIIRGEKATSSADLYSLGIIAFLLFTGKKPFRDGNIATTFDATLRQSAFSFVELGCQLGARLERVLRRALSKNSEDRYSSATEFITACEKALGNLALDSFSQVAPASEESISSSAVFKSQSRETSRRKSFTRLASIRLFLLIPFVIALLLSCTSVFIIFVLDINSSINQRIRSPLGIAFTAEDLKQMPSALLMQIMADDMPNEVLRNAILDARQRDTEDLANTISTLISHTDKRVRSEALKSIASMSSISMETKNYSLIKALSDPDSTNRIFAATELAKSLGKKAKNELSSQLTIENDEMATKVIEFLISKL